MAASGCAESIANVVNRKKGAKRVILSYRTDHNGIQYMWEYQDL